MRLIVAIGATGAGAGAGATATGGGATATGGGARTGSATGGGGGSSAAGDGDGALEGTDAVGAGWLKDRRTTSFVSRSISRLSSSTWRAMSMRYASTSAGS